MHFSCEGLQKVWNLSFLSNACEDAVEKMLRLCIKGKQNFSEVIYILPVKLGVKLWKQRRPSRLVE